MSLSNFTAHNVVRTYARQQRLSHVGRIRSRAGVGGSAAERLTLSLVAQKIRGINQFAAELVDRHQPNLAANERVQRIQVAKQDLISRYWEEITDDSLLPEALCALLMERYS